MSQGPGKARTGTYSDLFDVSDADHAALEGRAAPTRAATADAMPVNAEDSGILDIQQMALAYQSDQASCSADAIEPPPLPASSPLRLSTALPPANEPHSRGLSKRSVAALSIGLVAATATATLVALAAFGVPVSGAAAEPPQAAAEATPRAPRPVSAPLSATETSRGVNETMDTIKGRLMSCGDRHGFSGKTRLRFSITADGRVERTRVTSGSPAFHECIARVANDARFAQTERGLTIDYPFVFR